MLRSIHITIFITDLLYLYYIPVNIAPVIITVKRPNIINQISNFALYFRLTMNNTPIPNPIIIIPSITCHVCRKSSLI